VQISQQRARLGRGGVTEAGQCAREVVARAEQRVQQAMQAQLAAERARRFVAPPFTMPGEAINARR
jgi:hypothetical protein